MTQPAKRLVSGAGAILRGLLFFAASMGLSLGAMTLNSTFLPSVPWFALVAFAVALGGARWAEQRWTIGLDLPDGVDWGRMWLLGVAVTIAGVCVCVLQGAWNGLVRDVEYGPPGMPQLFTLAYAFGIPITVAIIAETSFRGIMQTSLHRAFAVWPTIAVVAAINAASHRWEEFIMQWFGLFVALAGLGYLRWVSGSLIPPLTAHVLANVLLAAATWAIGPFSQGALSALALGGIGALAAASLAFAVYLGRGLQPPRKLPGI